MSFGPKLPECYSGRRDHLAVETFVKQVKSYLELMQALNPNVTLTDANAVAFAATLLEGTAANWWYILTESEGAPTTWNDFATKLRTEFVPGDYTHRARNRRNKVKQFKSVNMYLSEFRNLTIPIVGMTEDEKLDRFVYGLNPEIRVEVMKSNSSTFPEAIRIALSVDSALFSVRSFIGGPGPSNNNGVTSAGNVPTPMEI